MEASVLRDFLETHFDALRTHGMVLHTHDGKTMEVRPYSILDLCEDDEILYILEFISVDGGADEVNDEHSVFVSTLKSVSVKS